MKKVSKNDMESLNGGFKPAFSVFEEGNGNGEVSYMHENCVPHPYNTKYCKIPPPNLNISCLI